MKNLRHIMVAITAALGIGVGSAVVFPPQDWVWEYRTDCGVIDNKPLQFFFKMKFDGEVNLDGFTWHCFKTVDSYCINRDDSEISRPFENGSTFLIRADNNKWFVRLPEMGSDLRRPSVLWYYDLPVAPLYDFNVEVGDIMESLDFLGNVATTTVTSTSSCTIDGNHLKILTVHSELKKIDMTIVENIGPVNLGILPFLQLDIVAGYPGMVASLPVSSENQYLVKVYDGNGNVLFDASEFTAGISDVAVEPENETSHLIYDLFGRVVMFPQPGSVYIRNGKKYIP